MAHVTKLSVNDHVVHAAADLPQSPLPLSAPLSLSASARVGLDQATTRPSAVPSRDQIITRRAVEGLIADGHTIVIFDGQVLKLDKWLEKHPGGKLPLLQMIGVDATSEIKA